MFLYFELSQLLVHYAFFFQHNPDQSQKCTTVHVGNGKCGSEATVKIEGALAEFMKFARGIEKNEINKFIDKQTGEVVDFMAEVNATANRISSKLNTILGNIKGTVLKEVELFIQKIIKNLAIPDPDIAEPVKEQLKTIGDLIACLFKSMLGDLTAFIKGNTAQASRRARQASAMASARAPSASPRRSISPGPGLHRARSASRRAGSKATAALASMRGRGP